MFGQELLHQARAFDGVKAGIVTDHMNPERKIKRGRSGSVENLLN
jgi:hypothetical protein